MDSSHLYRDILDFAHSTPAWVQTGFEVWTEAGLLVFGALYIVLWWRARTQGSRQLALAVLAPLVTAIGYVASEAVKSTVTEERPCRAVAGAAASLVPCPPPGDWSFPSNHSAIAGAAAMALAVALPRLALLTIPMALVMAFSRVFVGVHYPHDVAMGLLLGGSLSALLMVLLTGPGARLMETMRGSRVGVLRWFTGPGPRVSAVAAPAVAGPPPGAFAGPLAGPAPVPFPGQAQEEPNPYRSQQQPPAWH
ncbi:phosphatase PAP2 family protein [Streptomyces sp. BI20]|uniref:phosphatase PAP2 family protein n=1 Tax=Streptomyces sp. BI20 TaxID=3403460 RepID=UPI003C7717F6